MNFKNLELVSNYTKVTGYKVNIQKSIAFLYTSNKEVEFEVKNTIIFTFASPQNKDINLNMYKIYMRKTTKLW